MDLKQLSRKDIGNLGEEVAAAYLKRAGFAILARNFNRKTGELDVIASRRQRLHIVEVKTIVCEEFPSVREGYSPADNLHRYKISKVARTAEWYVAECGWKGEWQIDGVLIWLRFRDALAKVVYISQIIQ